MGVIKYGLLYMSITIIHIDNHYRPKYLEKDDKRMSEMKTFIEQEIEKRETVYLTKYVIAQQDYARESEDWQSYHGRELLELLQNADDEMTEDLPAKVKISFHNNRLTVSNNGEPFSKEGIVSLMYSNVSPKRKRKKEVIGNKGTGFRSILGWSKEISIHSGDLHIRFTREYSQSCVDKLFAGKSSIPDDITAAVLAFSEWISDYEPSGYTTDISLVIKDDELIADDIKKQINNINSELLLFLNRIEELILETDEKTCRFVKYGNTCVDYFENDELVDHQEWYMNRSDDNEYEGKKYSVVVAYNNSGEMPQKQVLYTFFPTKISFPYPVLVHANFDVDSNRNHLIENEANRAILSTVADMVIDTAKRVNSKGVSYSILEFLLPTGDIPIDLKDYDFEDVINEKIHAAEIFPTVNKKYVSFNDDLIYYEGGLGKYVSGKEFKDLLMFSENKDVEEYIENSYESAGFKVYTYETLVNKLNSWVLTLSHTDATLRKAANCVVSILEEDYYDDDFDESSLRILFNDEFEIVSNVHPVFLQKDEIEATIPPRFAQIEFLHPDMVKAFKKAVPGKNLGEYLKPLNVKEYKTEDIIDCMNDHVETFLENKKEKRAYECAINEIKWLWDNRSTLGEIEEISIYLPTRARKLQLSSELYFGEEYGNTLGAAIVSAINTDSFVMDFSELLSASANSMISFLAQFGVERFPRIGKKSIGTYHQLDYWTAVFGAIDYPYSQEGIEYKSATEFAKNFRGIIKVDYIDGIENILDNCETETIIEWINHDTRIFNHVTNHVEPDLNNVMGTWGNLRTDRVIKGIGKPLSYLYYMFYSHKWIRVNNERYSIADCLLSLDDRCDLSPELVAPSINEYIKDIPQKKTKLRADYTALFEKMGVKRDFAELPVEKIYSVLLYLPSVADSGSIARTFYSQMIDENVRILKQLESSSPTYEKFLKEGKVFCQDGLYHKIRETYYVAGKDVCSSIIDRMHVMALPKRRANFKSVSSLFGVKRVQLKGVSLKSVSPHASDEKFQKDFSKYKSLAFSYRVDAKKDIKAEARKFGNINIHLCEDVVLDYKKEEIHLNPFDFYLMGASEYFLSVPVALESIHVTKMGIAVSSIICSYLDVFENESDFRELYNAGNASERMMILRESVDDVTIQRAREAMNDEEDNRDDFLQIIDKLSDRPLNDVMGLVDLIDFENFTSIVNASTIISLFRTLDIDIDDYNKAKPSVHIDLSEYNRIKIEDTLPKYRERYNLTLYNNCLKGNIEKKESFQSGLLAFNNVEIKYSNSVYFDAATEIVKQLGIDLNCKNYDLAGIYKKNLSLFRKMVDENEIERIDEFLQYPENGSLIYFAEFYELKKRLKEYLVSEIEEIQTKISELTEGVEPIVATDGEITPMVPEVIKGKVIHKTGGAPTRNKRKLTDMGLRGEQCVYQLLSKDPEKHYVLWVSENAQKTGINPEGVAVLGYDMEYVDERLGKCYVEVKASSSSLEEGIHFHMSENEYRFACEHSDRYFVYYVASVNDKHPKVVSLGDIFKNDEFNNSKYYLSAREYYVSANYIPSQTSSKG